MGTAFDTPDEVRLLVDVGPAGLSQHRRAWPRGRVVVRAQHRRPRNPGRPGHLRVSHRAGVAALLPQHAGAQHGGHRRRGPVGAGRQFHVDAITRRRAASNSKPAPSGSVSSANTTATSGSPIRWCTGARSFYDTRRQVIEVTDMLRCDGEHRARRSWHFAEDCQVERAGSGLKVTAGLDAGVFRAARRTRQHANCIAAADRSRAAGCRAASGASSRARRCTGIRASRASRCCARVSLTRGHAPLASEPAILEVDLHQVVTADVPSGERTHALRHDDYLRTLQRDRRHRRRDAQRGRAVSRRRASPVAAHADHRLACGRCCSPRRRATTTCCSR